MSHKIEDWDIIFSLGGIVLKNVSGNILEIGIGVSSFIFSNLAKTYKRKYYACDVNKDKCSRLTIDTPTAIVFNGRSLDFFKNTSESYSIKQEQFALILLDGDHTYPVVRAEVDFLLTRLNYGGLLFIHDTIKKSWDEVYLKTGTEDVYLVRKELENDPFLQVITFPYTADNRGLTMVMQKDINVPTYK